MAAPTGVNEGASQEPAEAGSAQPQSMDTRPIETRPMDTRPTETRPAETRPAETRPTETRPAEVVPPPAQPAEGELGQRKAEGAPAGAEPDAAARADAEPGEAGGPDADAGEDVEEESRGAGWLAVAGIILGIIALVAAAAGVLAVVTHGFRPKTVVTYRPAAVFGLRPGECVNIAPNGLSVTVVSCAAPHDAEVFASFSLPASAWPGTAAVQRAAADSCASRLGGYLNPAFAGAALTEEYVYPDRTAWLAGERTVVCEVRAANGPLTGSVGKGG